MQETDVNCCQRVTTRVKEHTKHQGAQGSDICIPSVPGFFFLLSECLSRHF